MTHTFSYFVHNRAPRSRQCVLPDSLQSQLIGRRLKYLPANQANMMRKQYESNNTPNNNDKQKTRTEVTIVRNGLNEII